MFWSYLKDVMSVEGESRGFLGLFLDPAVDPKRPFLGLEGLHISFPHFTITITSNIIMKKYDVKE